MTEVGEIDCWMKMKEEVARETLVRKGCWNQTRWADSRSAAVVIVIVVAAVAIEAVADASTPPVEPEPAEQPVSLAAAVAAASTPVVGASTRLAWPLAELVAGTD